MPRMNQQVCKAVQHANKERNLSFCSLALHIQKFPLSNPLQQQPLPILSLSVYEQINMRSQLLIVLVILQVSVLVSANLESLFGPHIHKVVQTQYTCVRTHAKERKKKERRKGDTV